MGPFQVEVGWGSLQEKLETGMIFFWPSLFFLQTIYIYAIEQLSLWAKSTVPVRLGDRSFGGKKLVD